MSEPKVTKNGKTTFDGFPEHDVTVDGVVIGTVFRYRERVNHSVNNVLTHVSYRNGWRYEARTTGLWEKLPYGEVRSRARRLAQPRFSWETRARAVAELVTAHGVLATLAS